jgi:hypothetical protein
MSDAIPKLGTPEGTRVEFKRADKLRNHDRRRGIVETVVAMRNTQGGSIWIGFTEDGGGMTGVDPLGADDRRHIDSLQNQLIDLVEPMIELERDVELRTEDVPGGWVLEVRVRKGGEAGPTCLLHGTSRKFLTRSGSRNALLPYSSIVRGKAADQPSIRVATEERHDAWSEKFRGYPGLAFTAVPDPHRHPDDLPAKAPENALQLLNTPPAGLIRLDGWTWFSKHSPAKRYQRVVRTGTSYKDEPYRFLELKPDGTLQFFTGTDHLSWRKNEQAAKVAFPLPLKGQMYPYAVIETVASLIRIYSELLRLPENASLRTVGLVLSFERARGWVVCRAGPDAWFGACEPENWFQVPESSTRTPVLLQTAAAIRELPDTVSYGLLTELLQHEPKEHPPLPWFEGAPEAPIFAPPR